MSHTKVAPSVSQQHDLRGPALEKAFLTWDDDSEDAGASSIFGRQGVFVGKPAWYVMWLLGLWWFFDFTYCTMSQPDVGMFGQFGLCASPLLLPASLLSAMGTIGASTVLMIKYRGYAKPLLFVVIFAGVLNVVNGILIITSNYCSTDKMFRISSNTTTTTSLEWKADRPCGFEMAIIPIAYGLCQMGAVLFLIAPQYSFFQITGGLFMYNIGLVVANIVKGAPMDFGQLGPSLGFVVVGTFFKYKYDAAIKKAIHLTKKDYDTYREVWIKTLTTYKEDLIRLQNIWSKMISKAPKNNTKRQPSNSKSGPLFFFGKKYVLRQDPTISELYSVADQVNPELQKKCQEWSQTLPCCESEHKGNMAKFHPGSVKKTARALVKVYRSYDEDVGRLCDLCRCSLVFATVSDMATGLEMICEDNEIEIQKCSSLKQRFALEYDDQLSAGYRDVQLSIKVKTDANKRYGNAAENHLCEVQLHLKAFYEKKGAGGHDNYKISRNLRGA